MPGPSNIKKKRKSHTHKRKLKSKPRRSLGSQSPSVDNSETPPSRSSSQLITPPQSDDVHFINSLKKLKVVDDYDDGACLPEPVGLVPRLPYIHDPGNGPRVRDTRAFLGSSYFAQPPAWEDPLCAEFAQEEVLQMLCTVLPEETAMILWYNKSRATGRICPACQRLYRLGDILPNHADDESEQPVNQPPSQQLEREQEISGLCSPICFILASFNYPGAIRSAWGCMADEMDEQTWALLNSPSEQNSHGEVSTGLGMLVKMTRLHDLGLAQLCLGEQEGDDGDWYDETSEDNKVD